VVTRFLSLAAEIPLVVANAVAFGALLVQGARAGRVAHRALTWGAAVALAGVLLTLVLQLDAVWLMEAWRVEPPAQVFKALILAGTLASVKVSRDSSQDWHAERATGPLFRLVCASGLVGAAGAGDLLVLWLSLDVATAALVLEVATAGRWSQREKVVRRMITTWLPASLVMLLGIIVLAALSGSTRLYLLERALPELRGAPAVTAAVLLMAGSALVRAARLVALLAATRQA